MVHFLNHLSGGSSTLTGPKLKEKNVPVRQNQTEACLIWPEI